MEKDVRISAYSKETIYKNRHFQLTSYSLLKEFLLLSKKHKNITTQNVEKTLITYLIENHHLDQDQISTQLKELFGI